MRDAVRFTLAGAAADCGSSAAGPAERGIPLAGDGASAALNGAGRACPDVHPSPSRRSTPPARVACPSGLKMRITSYIRKCHDVLYIFTLRCSSPSRVAVATHSTRSLAPPHPALHNSRYTFFRPESAAGRARQGQAIHCGIQPPQSGLYIGRADAVGRGGVGPLPPLRFPLGVDPDAWRP